MRLIFRLVVLCAVLGIACSPRKNLSKDNKKIDVSFVLINDVYEIAPLSGGREGGVARVASLKKQYLQKNPNTFLILAGDFLSPSVYNSLSYEGKPIRGRQMVECLNAAGLDYAVFGNHEFDIKEEELQGRIDQSQFQWISSNAFHRQGNKTEPFRNKGIPVPRSFVLRVKDKDGTLARIGFITATLPFNKAEYVAYSDALESARLAYNELKDSVDAVVAITHQTLNSDKKLAEEIPGLSLILGGHEHDMRFEKKGNVYISKAHANAKSAYVVDLHINQKKREVKAEPKLVYINETIPLDSAVNTIVEKWSAIAEKSYSSLGLDTKKTVISSGAPLDGREAEVRTHPTNLTQLIVSSIQDAAPQAAVVLMNAGSIRVDDVLPVPVSEYDIIRTLPFGGGIREVEMKGSLLIKVLEQGKKNAGSGGYLQYNKNLDTEGEIWMLNGLPLSAVGTYRVALTDFLLSGREANLGFLHPSNPGIIKIYEPPTSLSDARSDVRLAIVRYLEKN